MIGDNKSRCPFQFTNYAWCIPLVIVFLSQKEKVECEKDNSGSEKKNDRQKGKMADERVVWKAKLQLARAGQGAKSQSSQSSQRSMWREISAEVDTVGITVNELTKTWSKSCKESLKREKEQYTIVEAAVEDGRKTRGTIRELLVLLLQ